MTGGLSVARRGESRYGFTQHVLGEVQNLDAGSLKMRFLPNHHTTRITLTS